MRTGKPRFVIKVNRLDLNRTGKPDPRTFGGQRDTDPDIQ